MTNPTELTPRERMALRVLAVMFKIIAPNQRYSHINDRMLREIFTESENG